MSRKHNTKHYRKRSNYLGRLAKRGLSKTPKMPSLEALRSRQTTKDGLLYAEYG